jgi:predicted CopG family antitoxin
MGSLNAKRRWLKKNPRRTISISDDLYRNIKEEAEQESLTLMDMVNVMYSSYKNDK